MHRLRCLVKADGEGDDEFEQDAELQNGQIRENAQVAERPETEGNQHDRQPCHCNPGCFKQPGNIGLKRSLDKSGEDDQRRARHADPAEPLHRPFYSKGGESLGVERVRSDVARCLLHANLLRREFTIPSITKAFIY